MNKVVEPVATATLEDQISILETYRPDDDLPRIVAMIVKGELAHSTLEGWLAKGILHAYACLSSRDAFLGSTNQFGAYTDTLPKSSSSPKGGS